MKQPTCPKCGYPLEETRFGIDWDCPNCNTGFFDSREFKKVVKKAAKESTEEQLRILKKSKKKGKVVN